MLLRLVPHSTCRLERVWKQMKMPTLKGGQERLEGYQSRVEAQLAGENRKVINAGLVDNLEKSAAAAALPSSPLSAFRVDRITRWSWGKRKPPRR